MATRYKVTKEQVEKLVENFVTEAAASEATKHLNGSEGGVMVEKRPNSGGTPPKKDFGRNDAKKHSAEAKKHVSGSVSGDMVDERQNTPKASEVNPGSKKEKKTQPRDVKKHISGSVSENLEEGIFSRKPKSDEEAREKGIEFAKKNPSKIKVHNSLKSKEQKTKFLIFLGYNPGTAYQTWDVNATAPDGSQGYFVDSTQYSGQGSGGNVGMAS